MTGPSVGTHRCSKCQQELEAAAFGLNRATNSGLKSRCKVCASAEIKEWRASNPDKVRAAAREWGKANPDKVRENYKRWADKNPERAAEAACAWAKRHPDLSKAAAIEWQAKNQAHVALSKKNWVAANREKYKADQAAWRASHPEVRSALNAKRRARMRAVAWADKRRIEGVYRRAREAPGTLGFAAAVDHIYPLQGKAASGLHVEANLRVIPRSLNCRKKDKLPGFLAQELWDPAGRDVFHEATQ